MNRKLWLSLAGVACLALVGGCIWFGLQHSNANTPSKVAQDIVTAMISSPNPDLYDAETMQQLRDTPIEQLTDAQKETAAALHERTKNNWEAAIGSYFAENAFSSFYINGLATWFLSDAAFPYPKPVVLKDILLLEKKPVEKVLAYYTLDGAAQFVEFAFITDADGKIITVMYFPLKK